MTELFFHFFLSLSEPWNPLKKFLVQTFKGDISPQVWASGRDRQALMTGGRMGDNLAQVSFQVVAEGD